MTGVMSIHSATNWQKKCVRTISIIKKETACTITIFLAAVMLICLSPNSVSEYSTRPFLISDDIREYMTE
jgi:hypothetical protein